MKYNQIKTWEDICKALNISPDSLPDVSKLPVKDQKWVTDHYKLTKAIEAVNGDWEADWNNSDQPKYYLWPDIIKDETHPSGFGLSCYVYDYWATYTIAGSRLCVESKEKLKHVFDHFKEWYISYFLKDKI